MGFLIRSKEGDSELTLDNRHGVNTPEEAEKYIKEHELYSEGFSIYEKNEGELELLKTVDPVERKGPTTFERVNEKVRGLGLR